MPKLSEIKSFTRSASWSVDVSWNYLEEWISGQIKDSNLDLNPDFQRAHVWSPEQQIRYVEFILRGGQTGRELLFNCPNWQQGNRVGPYVIVDGKQRLEAVRAFLRDAIPAFGHVYSEYEDKNRMRIHRGFKWCVNDLETRAEVLQWYLDTNTGGTQHTSEEIEKVREMLKMA